jgi:glycine/D-amino acid oxidase-like deaminating enzyme
MSLHFQSPWLDRFPRARRPTYPRLTASLEIPIVVVGGGLAGCATAYALAAAGQRVALVDGEQLACGGTAQASGLLLASPGVDFLPLERRHGRRVARALWQHTRRAALDAQATLRRLKVKCDLRPADAIQVARDDVEAKALRRELASLKGAGLEGVWLTGRALAQATGLDGAGGLKTTGHASLDPYRAALGLAHAAAARGAVVFERTSIDTVRHTRTGVELAAGRVRIQATTIVVATGRPAPLFKALSRHFVEGETYSVLTPPLGAAVRRTAGAADAILTDQWTPPHRLRWTSDHRVLWTGADQLQVPERQRRATLVQRTGQLMYELSLALPSISGVQPDYGWHAPWSVSVDEVPFIGAHRNYPHHLFALGLGSTLASAFLAGRILARAVLGQGDRSDEYFGFARIARKR